MLHIPISCAETKSVKHVHLTQFLRKCSEFVYEITEPLTMIFNDSLNSCIFPDVEMNYYNTPTSRDMVNELGHLRLVFLTPDFGKVFGGILGRWLIKDIKSRLYTFQDVQQYIALFIF